MTKATIENHYKSVWLTHANKIKWSQGPMRSVYPEFCILEFKPTNNRKHWTYATCGMSAIESFAVELHVFSATKDESLAEILTAAAYYHITTRNKLDIGHTIHFGRPWKPDSICNHGLVSLPYLDGPALENCFAKGIGQPIKCYWLIPISEKERSYKISKGLEALETAFEEKQFNYLDPNRLDVICPLPP